ncbi:MULTISPECIES: mannose-1-phosphate guanylyltransferase/mannose-6-phosphate isomerase [Diaphorobacter]|uniref:mannose-1-phosphate guanylyltransferase n=1 Tax=Acidovorax ebreus (strain TPSY) TaxID=535289 RepID=A0A9J9QCZ5_ACIET|nr:MULTISPECIES: mannose-1-phosphate guanylyltransferase/mannose-6-phosphate isomerase [Diaphorobacter]ACM32046.1 mannose-1-phosphate guanylyltransferase/mannose-6-phosphate isomerase [[Acidovorax] ebreus TPSY]
MHLVSVVLSGGSGTRLWPVSRQSYPKPFMQLGGSTLLGQAIGRGQDCGTDDLIIVTNQDYFFLSRNVVNELSDVPHTQYLLEPKGRNTAPAIALAALACARLHGPEAVMLVLPADHLIPDTEAFVACALEAARHAQQGQLVVFGISPTGPETGFGYIEVEKPSRHTQQALRFVEKPDLPTAQRYLASGRYYWNSGMFCFTAGAILQAMKEHAPEVLHATENAWAASHTQDGATKFDARTFGLLPDISIDYAVMERARNVTLVPAKFGWSDVGSWPAVAQAHPADTSGNTFVDGQRTEFVAVGTTGTHVQVESHGPKVVATVGVQDLVIVDTPDALLVAHKSVAQKVKTVVDTLRDRRHDSTQLPAAVHRPWGTYATLKEEDGYKVKRITVNPGQALSLQYHHQRAEHWVVVQGTAMVQIGEDEHHTLPGQYRYIPLKEKHRLTNIGQDELVLIEVQCGDYLGEDDIVRLADTYGRA